MRTFAWILLIVISLTTICSVVFAQSTVVKIDRKELTDLAKAAEKGQLCCDALRHTAVQVQVQADSTHAVRMQLHKATVTIDRYRTGCIVLLIALLVMCILYFRRQKT